MRPDGGLLTREAMEIIGKQYEGQRVKTGSKQGQIDLVKGGGKKVKPRMYIRGFDPLTLAN